jgi:septal ring factor EnvC (AmiA/AmiB activator)
MGDGQRPELSPEKLEKMAKMKAAHEGLMKLGEAARNETDPAKKEALIGQLRTKLTEDADKMLIEQKKRLEKAEKEVPKLKKRMEEFEKNKSARIEEQIQRILTGESPKKPEGKRPEGPSAGKHKKDPKPPSVE